MELKENNINKRILFLIIRNRILREKVITTVNSDMLKEINVGNDAR